MLQVGRLRRPASLSHALQLIAGVGQTDRMSRLILASLAFLLPVESTTPRLYLGTGGRPGEPEFRVVLSPDGVLEVSRTSQPATREGTPTTTKVEVTLGSKDVEALIDRAMAVDDLDLGCPKDAVHFTSAVLFVETDAGVNERRADNCPGWPKGPKAKAFLDALNSFLPRTHRVF